MLGKKKCFFLSLLPRGPTYNPPRTSPPRLRLLALPESPPCVWKSVPRTKPRRVRWNGSCGRCGGSCPSAALPSLGPRPYMPVSVSRDERTLCLPRCLKHPYVLRTYMLVFVYSIGIFICASCMLRFFFRFVVTSCVSCDKYSRKPPPPPPSRRAFLWSGLCCAPPPLPIAYVPVLALGGVSVGLTGASNRKKISLVVVLCVCCC